MWCEVRDKIKSATSDWNWKMILLYLCVIVLFVFIAYQTYYKYILPRLNPDFVPNREFIQDFSLTGSKPLIPGAKKPSGGGEGDPAELLFFCVKWCPHCKKAEPEWNKLVSKFENKKINKSKVFFKKIDCEDDEALADEYKVEGYPTIKLLVNDGDGERIIEYNAKPNADTLEEFLRSQL